MPSIAGLARGTAFPPLSVIARPPRFEIPSFQRPRVFYGWYIVAAAIATNFYLSLSFFQGFQAFFLPILNEFGWSRTFLSGAYALRQLESGIASPVVGVLVDRIGPRRLIGMGVVITGAGMIMLGFTNSEWMYYVGFMLTSIGTSAASHGITWPTVVSNWFRRLRGRAMGLTVIGPVLGGPLLFLVVMLEQALGWRMALVALGVGVWVVCIPLTLVIRTRPEDHGLLPDGDMQPTARPAVGSVAQSSPRPVAQELSGGYSLRQAYRTRAFWVLSLIFTLHTIGVQSVLSHHLPLLQSAGFSPTDGALAIGLVFFLSGIGRIGAGALMDMVDRRLVIIVVLVLTALAYLSLVFITPVLWKVMLYASTFGVGFGSLIPIRPMLIREVFGSRAFGSINGLILGISIGPTVVAPVFMGAVFDYLGTYTPALLVFMVTTLAIVPIAFFVRTTSLELESLRPVGAR